MQRDQSLDALRGFAILAMVLSGSIAYGGVLPAWMYHAQVPPPLHQFNPALPGITWVDLVFPFFLFSMGAAIPLSLTKLEHASFWQIGWIALRRYVLLTFFALFIFHMRAWVLSEAPAAADYLLSLFGFVLLFFQFYNYTGTRYKLLFSVAKFLSFAVAVFLLYQLPFNKGEGFLVTKSDIIILVLANVAFFGTLIWWLTKKQSLIRVGLLPFVMAVFLGSKEAGSWNEAFFNFSPLPWMYKFYYLKYLFIILPGTIAGEWMLQKKAVVIADEKNKTTGLISLFSTAVIVINVALLFSRHLVLNLFLTAVILWGIYFLVQPIAASDKVMKKFFKAGAYLLLLGLFFEAYEGGIKKDSSTYSYYFVISGLAFFMLLFFYGMAKSKPGTAVVNYLSLNGRNPMVAYVAGNLLLLPVLHLTGGITFFDSLNTNAGLGFLRGVLFTGLVSLITVFFTKQKWFWKT